ncbi:MAG TPA: FKBP-type peptidyl-prolyl cis-trans isomerase [Mycobacteriales bacterium]|nr:FKBP-type peptidyl-prolyl cis-trans isomerase [Mycobacteriales bacterium]
MRRSLLPALALALALAGCSGDNGKDSVGQASPTPSITPAPTASGCPTGAPTTDLTKKPVVVMPDAAAPPATTTSTDVVVGKGAEAMNGSAVAVKYVGVLFDSCQEFDSSWKTSPQQTLPFTVGGGVIPGFSKGVTGMHVGGRRQVVIPASEGYGPGGSGPIPPNATLIFVIDLVSVS